MGSQIGRALRRVEDPRLITGRGHYAGDVRLPDLAHLAVVRSTLGHARINSIDTAEAHAMPGVLEVWTAPDLPETARFLEDGVPRGVEQRKRPVLAAGAVHFVGEAVAVVVAETSAQAQDAAQAVYVDYEQLPAAGTVAAAIAEGAPRVHEDLESNLTGGRTIEYGDHAAAFSDPGTVTASQRFTLARICGSAMEPRVVTAAPEPAGGITIWDSTQAVFHVREQVAARLGIEPDLIHVLADDVGGGFGPKAQSYPEETLVALAAHRLRRPVRWTATRSEDGATTMHAHGIQLDLEIASDRDGKIRGLRGTLHHDVGAYPSAGAGQPGIITSHMVSTYKIPAMSIASRLVYTNTAPTGFVRGGGRPVGNFAIERMIDRLARALDMDPAELRRRNLVQPGEMPFDTGFPQGRSSVVYDGGDYPRLLQIALDEIGYDQFRQQSHRDREDGRVRGVGLACCVESSGFGRGEQARVRVQKDGSAHLFVGSTPQGQGHRTVAAQVLADRLGWPLDRIEVTAGDTRSGAWGEMTAGSRTAVQVGNATAQAGTAMRKLLIERAAEVLEADPLDVTLEDGVIAVKGAPARSIPASDAVPEHGLELTETFEPPRPLAFSSGCHAALVAVDPETGSVEIEKYVIVHDTGKAINTRLVEGQMQGGFAHGLGYSLFEEAVYQDDGGFISPSFLDYTIPGLPEVIGPVLRSIETPTDANPEGFKGAGESGTVPVPAAIANAVEDALSGIKPGLVVDAIPITPNRLHDLLGPG